MKPRLSAAAGSASGAPTGPGLFHLIMGPAANRRGGVGSNSSMKRTRTRAGPSVLHHIQEPDNKYRSTFIRVST